MAVEAKDYVEKDLPQVTNYAFKRVLDASGNPAKISKEDEATVLGELLKGLLGLNDGFYCKNYESAQNVPQSLRLKAGIYIYINEGNYGFCDIVSIWLQQSTWRIKTVSATGYGTLLTDTIDLSAGQRCVFIDSSNNEIVFKQRNGLMQGKIIRLG